MRMALFCCTAALLMSAAPAVHAAHHVILTGETKDDTLTVSKIEMPKAGKSKTDTK